MTGKILRNSYLVAISALLASALLFFGVMYRDYEDEAFARLRAETSAIAQGLVRKALRILTASSQMTA